MPNYLPSYTIYHLTDMNVISATHCGMNKLLPIYRYLFLYYRTMNAWKRTKEYKSIYANIPKTQKRMAIDVFIGAVFIFMILVLIKPVGIVSECFQQMCISVASAALFAIIYSLFADYNLIKEVATRVSNEFNHSVPINIYPANDHPENLFKEL